MSDLREFLLSSHESLSEIRHNLCLSFAPHYLRDHLEMYYRSGTVNLNTINSKFHLIQSY